MQKYGFDDARPVLERASARETAARVALGAVARGVPARRRSASRWSATWSSSARCARRTGSLPGPGRRRRASTPTRCAASTRPPPPRWSPRSTRPEADGDTLGGVVEVRRLRPAARPRQPRALGPPARRPAGRRADGHPGDQGRRGRRRLRDGARRRGSAAHDEIERGPDGVRRRDRPRRRHRGRHDHRRGAAGARRDEADLDGAARAATPSTSRTGEAAKAINQRSDVCAVPAAGVVAEAMVALVLADAVLEKFGGDSRRRDRAATCAATSTHLVVPADGAAWSSSSGRPAPARRTVGRLLADRLGVAVPRHRRRRRARGRAERSPTSSSTTARRTSARWSAPRWRAALAEHDGVLALGGGAVLDDGTRAAAGRPHAWSS